MELSDHMRCDYFTNTLSGGSAGINRTTDRRNVTTHDRRHQAGVDLFPTDEANVRSFDHRVRSLDHGYESAAFNHSERFRHDYLPAKINTDFSISYAVNESERECGRRAG
jgi:hypothetical protein